MADNINPTQPLTPSLPVSPPPEDKRQDKKKQPQQNDDAEQEQNDDKPTPKRPHHGLFDEYV